MPTLPKEVQKERLHQYIYRLLQVFPRDSFFMLDDLYTCGGTTRHLVDEKTYLPLEMVPIYLDELAQKGLVNLQHDNGQITFQITDNYAGLPDLVTPVDIYKEKFNMLGNKLGQFCPSAYAKMLQAQRKLLKAESDSDFSEVGNLCIQVLEDFTEKLWEVYMPNEPRPAKKQTKDKLAPIMKKFVVSKTQLSFEQALWNLFSELSSLNEALKHRGERVWQLRDAKTVVFFTVFIVEEVLFYTGV